MIKLFRERQIQDAFLIIENNIPRRVNNITDNGITGLNLANFNRTVLANINGNILTIGIQTLYGNSELNDKTKKRG